MNKILIAILSIVLLAASCNVRSEVKVGIVKTANGGIDWQPANKIVGTDQTLLARSISQLKYNPGENRIYASSFSGGLFYSEDAAENWNGFLGGIPVYDFVFHPFDENIIYASSYLSDRGRLLMSKDAGKSWNEIYSDASTKNPVRAVALNPNNPDEILIGLGKGALIKSEDNGASWHLLQNYNDRINRIVWENNDLYVIVRGTGVFRSTDNGSSFSQITRNLRTPRNNDTNRSNFTFSVRNSINDFRQLAIDPNNSEHLLLTTSRGLFESSDAGNSWVFIELPYRRQDISPFAVAFANSSDTVMYVSVGSVVLKSIDGGRNWSSSDTKTNGLVNSLLVDPELPQLAFAGVSQ
jgi:hypothetical protein